MSQIIDFEQKREQLRGQRTEERKINPDPHPGGLGSLDVKNDHSLTIGDPLPEEATRQNIRHPGATALDGLRAAAANRPKILAQ